MKAYDLIFILIAGFVVIGLIGLIMFLHEKNIKLSEFGKKLGRFSVFAVGSLMLLIQSWRPIDSYSLDDQQDLWAKYNVPLIDSTMVLASFTNRGAEYISYSTDSVYHARKYVKMDLFDAYSIRDEFVNELESLVLVTIFIKPNLIRDSSRINTIRNFGDHPRFADTITKIRFDEILSEWGIADKAYRSFELF